MFDEITASSLVKIDLAGQEAAGDRRSRSTRPASSIHSAIHAARHDAQCVLHTHTLNGVAVSAQKRGLLPISQHSIFVLASLGYHDYEGVALHDDEKPRLVADLGDNTSLILRNHGLLTVGPTVADAFLAMYFLETSCTIQLRAQAGGTIGDGDLIEIPGAIIRLGAEQARRATLGTAPGRPDLAGAAAPARPHRRQLAPLKKAARAGRSTAPKRTAPSAATARRPPASPAREECILVLQGGGALGAYQAGVYEGLAECGTAPDWVAGISIGAINAALIAGNPPERRVARLREFWDRVSLDCRSIAAGLRRRLDAADARPRQRDQRDDRYAVRRARLLRAALAGGAVPAAGGTLGALSFYDTAPLRRTLEQLVDFDLHQPRRGAAFASARSTCARGNFGLFRQHDARRSTPSTSWRAARCRRASRRSRSTASSTGTAASSRTRRCSTCSTSRPASRGWCSRSTCSAPAARCRRNLAEVQERAKDIHYSSRTRMNTDPGAADIERCRRARRPARQAAAALRDDPDAKTLAALPAKPQSTVVHLIYRNKHYEPPAPRTTSSRAPRAEHWAAGIADMRRHARRSAMAGERRDRGRHVFDLTSPHPTAPP